MSTAADPGGLAKRLVQLWRSTRRRRTAATMAAEFLRPGVYRPLSETLWARRGARVPIHLFRTKGGGHPGATRASLPYRVLRTAAGTYAVPGPQRGRTAELVVAAYDGGVVVLDVAAQLTYRTYGNGPMTPEDEQRRRRFTEHVSAPRFRQIDGGTVVEEELVDGAHLEDLTVAEREAVIRTLVEQFAALTSSAGTETPAVTIRDLEDALRRIDVPPALAHAWETVPRRWLTPGTPWVPTPREANAKNIVVRPDGKPAPIDLGDLEIGPFFDYPVGILLAAGDAMVRRFLAGEADCAMGRLFAAAGQSWGGTAQERISVLVLRIVHAAHRDARAGRGTDPAVFAASLQRRWDDLRELPDLWASEPV